MAISQNQMLHYLKKKLQKYTKFAFILIKYDLQG